MIAKSPNTYLNQAALPYPFCPGCGHSIILDHLNEALLKLQLDPHKVVIILDIGCCGLSDKFFTTNAFHGLHGRSTTYATGIKLANPELKPIVLIGDGGCGIGGHHLINAARRNIGITVLVFNNMNYGMTGGEHSVTTPLGAITATTPYGQLERPMDICSSVAINGASFVARTTVYDVGLSDLIAQSIQIDGFSLIDIWELCTSYFAPKNRFNKKSLLGTMAALKFQNGIIHHEERPEYSLAYRQATANQIGHPLMHSHPLIPKFKSDIVTRRQLVIAGAAGTKIGSAANAFCQAAILSGIWASQRHDYPITVQSGHSLSEIILSPDEILYTGIDKPNIVLALFPEGLSKVRPKIERMTEADTLYVHADLMPVKTNARVVILNFTKSGIWAKRKQYWAIMALAELLRNTKIFPLEALCAAASLRKEFTEKNLAAIDASQGVTSAQ